MAEDFKRGWGEKGRGDGLWSHWDWGCEDTMWQDGMSGGNVDV